MSSNARCYHIMIHNINAKRHWIREHRNWNEWVFHEMPRVEFNLYMAQGHTISGTMLKTNGKSYRIQSKFQRVIRNYNLCDIHDFHPSRRPLRFITFSAASSHVWLAWPQIFRFRLLPLRGEGRRRESSESQNSPLPFLINVSWCSMWL